ncbi:MAG: type II secretion system F family protein [Lachnospiraceae bacterium]|nr:type II secretion system F family protein [Lachnospiraceae bacterium]
MGAMITCRKETELENVKKTQIELDFIVDYMKRTGNLKDKQRVKRARELKKNMEQYRKNLDRLDKGKTGLAEVIPIAGYRMMQLMHWDATNDTVKKLYNQCVQFKEKKEAMNDTYYILGTLIGYAIVGSVSFFAVLGLMLALGLGIKAVIFAAVVALLFILAGYVPYDNVNNTVRNRKEEIENEFPQVVSKLTLLTVAGMEVYQAWKLTGGSGSGVLYQEMNRVLLELDNNVPPTEVYSKFITRCNNPYTTKLATAIIQNASKGNSEIVDLFRRLNSESWLEHKHSARRRGEQISSKLLVPTLLMFVGIIILVIVPVMTGFNF